MRENKNSIMVVMVFVMTFTMMAMNRKKTKLSYWRVSGRAGWCSRINSIVQLMMMAMIVMLMVMIVAMIMMLMMIRKRTTLSRRAWAGWCRLD